MEEVLQYKDMEIFYRIIPSKRKTMAIQIKDEKTIDVKIPLECGICEAQTFVKAHEAWIYKHYRKFCEKSKSIQEFIWEDGTEILVGGKPVCVHVRSGTEDGRINISFQENSLVITGNVHTPDRIKEAVRQWFIHMAKQEFPSRTQYWSEVMGVDYGRITIRCQKSRWGSCSGKGNLNFNWKLLMLPKELMDYVIVHELAHRIEMNHSQRFWENVGKILPDYKGLRRRLKDYESQIISEF